MSDRDRPRIYFLHGLLATSYAHYGEQLQRWRGAYQVIPVDLPGHGRSRQEAEAPYYARCVSQLRHHLDQLGPGHVLGASYLGGTVALRCALENPEGFRSLVLSGYVPNAPHPVVTRWTQAFHAVADHDPRLVQHYEQLHGARWRRTLDCVLAEIRDSYPTTVAVSDDELASVEVATLILNGSLKSDERAAAARLPSLGPRIDAGIIPGAGHVPSHDEPELFALIVERFWRKLEGPMDRLRVRDIAPAGDPADAGVGEVST